MVITLSPRRRWTEDQLQAVLAAIENRASLEALRRTLNMGEAAFRAGVSHVKRDITNAVREHAPAHNAPWTVEANHALIEDFVSGMDLCQVIARCGRTPGAVMGKLISMGLVTLVGGQYFREERSGRKPLGVGHEDHAYLGIHAYFYDASAQVVQSAPRMR